MEVTGRVNKILGTRMGQSKTTGSDWMSLEFVFEFFENDEQRWSDKVVLEVFGEDRIKHLDLKVNDTLRVGIGHGVREYNGRTFNVIRAYKIEKLTAAPTDEAPAAAEAPAPAAHEAPPVPPITKEENPAAQLPGEAKDDDLPF